MNRYLVRVGVMAEIHTVAIPADRGRDRVVLVRSGRGVELAEVFATTAAGRQGDETVRFLRVTTRDDEWLLERLRRPKRKAVEACREALRRSGSPAVLLDVDQIFDGGTLVLHLLGPVDAVVEADTRQIVEEYESVVRSRKLTRLLTEGCGPGCGEASSGGCDGCNGCAIASACRPPVAAGETSS